MILWKENVKFSKGVLTLKEKSLSVMRILWKNRLNLKRENWKELCNRVFSRNLTSLRLKRTKIKQPNPSALNENLGLRAFRSKILPNVSQSAAEVPGIKVEPITAVSHIATLKSSIKDERKKFHLKPVSPNGGWYQFCRRWFKSSFWFFGRCRHFC